MLSTDPAAGLGLKEGDTVTGDRRRRAGQDHPGRRHAACQYEDAAAQLRAKKLVPVAAGREQRGDAPAPCSAPTRRPGAQVTEGQRITCR